MNRVKIGTSWARRTLLLLPLILAPCGCGPVDSPIGTAITDLTFEGRSQKTFWIDFSEYHSVNGLVPAQDVGTFYLTPKTFWTRKLLAPSFAMGFVADRNEKSFRLVGESTAIPADAEMDAAVLAISKVDRKARAAVEALIARAQIESRLASTRLPEAERAVLLEERTGARTALVTAETELQTAEAEADRALTKPNMIVARWNARKEGGGSVSAGSLAELSGSLTEGRGGYVIAGGLRVMYCFFGKDYAEALASVGDDFNFALGEISVTTYLLQARHIRYVSSLDFAAAVRLAADLDAKKLFGSPSTLLSDVDRVRLSGYIAAAARLRNQGAIGGMKWSKRKLGFPPLYDWDASHFDEDAKDPGARGFYANQTLSAIADGAPPEDQNWKTVNVIYARAPFLNKLLAKRAGR